MTETAPQPNNTPAGQTQPIPTAQAEPRTQPTAHQPPPMLPFERLVSSGDEVWIEHNGQIYRLRSTRQGKLILTK